jgi:hypothetical protein
MIGNNLLLYRDGLEDPLDDHGVISQQLEQVILTVV